VDLQVGIQLLFLAFLKQVGWADREMVDEAGQPVELHPW
jgi:hypothetical protein